jgi:predicted RNase H-like nuclease (RuvC/YqgF family)
MKLKGQMASQQDNLLLERQTAVDRTTQENNTLKQEISVIKNENEVLREKVWSLLMPS